MSGLQTTYIPEYTYGIEQLPIATNRDPIEQFMSNIMLTKPDLIIYVGEPYSDVWKFAKVHPNTIAYLVLEGRGIPQYVVDDIKNIQKKNPHFKIVATCKYAQQQFQNYGINVDMIYPGYDPNIFYPIKDISIDSKYCYYSTSMGQESIDPRALCKNGCYKCDLDIRHQINCNNYKEELISFAKYMNDKWTEIPDLPISKLKNEFNNRFIYAFLGQNHESRKRIERLLSAYSILIHESKQLRDHTHLHLHSNPQSPTGLDLLQIANNLNIQNNISFSYGTWRSSGLSDNAINIIYNLADVNVSATSSESPGLGHIESMAVGIPQIAADCTSMTELIGNNPDKTKNRGMLANIQTYNMIPDLTERALVDIEDLALKMKVAYVDKDAMRKYSDSAISYIKKYTWQNQCKEWDRLITKL